MKDKICLRIVTSRYYSGFAGSVPVPATKSAPRFRASVKKLLEKGGFKLRPADPYRIRRDQIGNCVDGLFWDGKDMVAYAATVPHETRNEDFDTWTLLEIDPIRIKHAIYSGKTSQILSTQSFPTCENIKLK